MQQLAPGLTIAGTRDGYDGLHDPQAAIDAINASGADMVWMATGVPHQDVWLAEHAAALNRATCWAWARCWISCRAA